jgi:hypothetical protein
MYPEITAHFAVCAVSVNHFRNSHTASCRCGVLLVIAITPPNWMVCAGPPAVGIPKMLHVTGFLNAARMKGRPVLVPVAKRRLPSPKRSCQSNPVGT